MNQEIARKQVMAYINDHIFDVINTDAAQAAI